MHQVFALWKKLKELPDLLGFRRREERGKNKEGNNGERGTRIDERE
jgi:hypothetical protein